MELFKILGTIAINGTQQAQQDIDGTSEKASKFGESLKSGIVTVGKWSAAIVAGAAAATTGLIAFATSAASTADNIDKMSQKIGISREAYQELDFICSQSGSDVDSLRVGMKTLTNQMQACADGTSSATAIFDKLGISVTDANGAMKSQEEMLWETLDALQSVENQSEKAALANDLFGKTGSDLMPLINGARGSIYEMKEQAHELGLVLDDELIDSGVEMTDTMDQLKRSFGAIVTKLGGSLMPIIQKVANYIISNMPKIQSMFDKIEPILTSTFEALLPPLMDLAEQLLPVLGDLIAKMLPTLITLIQNVLPIIVQLLPVLGDMFAELLPQLMQIIQTVLPIILQLIQELLPHIVEIVSAVLPVLLTLIQSILPILDALMPILEPLLSLLITILNPLLDLINLILPPLSLILTAIADFISNGLIAVIELLQMHFEGVGEVIKKVTGFFKDAWDGIKEKWEGAGDFFAGIWQGIKNAFGAVGDWFHDTFSKAWQKVKDVFSKGGKVFSGIKDGIADVFKTVVNTLIRGINTVISVPFKAINGMLNKIRNVGIFDLKPFHDLWDKNPLAIPEIPQLETGAVLEKGQVGLLEGNGAEAVVPLEKNKKWIKAVAEDMGAEFGGRSNEAVINKLDELIKAILSLRVYLNNDILVGELAPAMDAALGNISLASMRGQ